MILAEVKGRKYKVGNEHGARVLKIHCLEQWLLDSWSQDSFTLLKERERGKFPKKINLKINFQLMTNWPLSRFTNAIPSVNKIS